MFVEEKKQGEATELDEASNTLLRAAEIIEKKGHCNHASYGIDGSLCVHAAIVEAAEGANDIQSIVSAARIKLMAFERNVTTWSNESTQAAVIAKLRAVALSG